MSDIAAFLSHLSNLDIQLRVQGDRLRFNAPKGVLTPEISQEIATYKSEILAFLNQSAEPKILPIPHSDSHSESLPLSSAQQRLWFLEKLEGHESTAYNLTVTLKFSGRLDLNFLKQALEEIGRRHEALRTTFPTVDGTPIQVVSETSPFSHLPIVDLQELSASERVSEIKNLALQAAQQPFDLEQGPLLRVALLTVSKDAHVLLMTIHHIVFDGWSKQLFIRELSALYDAFSKGKPSPLPEVSVQYADFAHWQRQQQANLQQQLTYWQDHLAGAPPLLELPSDRPRPAQQTFRGDILSFELDAHLTQNLKQLSQCSGGTIFMLLLTAFEILLARYSQTYDIVVGSPISSRNCSEVEPLIGLFLNNLVLRTQLDPTWRFQDCFKAVRRVALDAYAHQDVPFEQVVDALQPVRSLSYTPLFQVMFTWQNIPVSNWQLQPSDVEIKSFEIGEAAAPFDLTLNMWETTARTFTGTWQYNCDLFDCASIERMIGHFKTLLTSIVADPQQRLCDLPLLTPPERQQLLSSQNETEVTYPQLVDSPCIHHLFEAQVERVPEQIAVTFQGQSLTYRSLNQRANQLAHYLQKLGVESEQLVGICLERSLDMLVGILAILKAGAAYVPLDPAYPSERLAYMLSDSQLTILITQNDLIEQLPETQAQIVCVDGDEILPSANTLSDSDSDSDINSDIDLSSNPTHPVRAQQLAYVIYTSGSTGKPKGVLIEHRSLSNFLLSMTDTLSITDADTLLAVTTLSFDISALELFLPLTVGATVALVSRSVAVDAPQLRAAILAANTTVMQATPATWRLLLSESWPHPLKILCGGEALPPDLAEQLLATGSSLWNLYGPTETTIWSTAKQIVSSQPPISIGQPIANTQLYLLDAYAQPVPMGVSGELYIGGTGLARGYLNRPELTHNKFVLSTFPLPASRLYKTGDLARYLPNGEIEILGRADHQVKLRGFRIELGEIETLLIHHASVDQAVVMVREDSPGDQQLVAYVKRVEGAITDLSEDVSATDWSRTLRDHLQQTLPGYMVPGLFVALDTFPLTPNGKVNRQALPAPDIRLASADAFVTSQDEIELRLTKIWERIFGLQPIGLTDNFFELGGHSLMAVRLFANIEKTFGKRIPLARLFEQPTIEQLAMLLREEGVENQWSALVPMQSQGHKPPFICIHSGYGEILVYQNLAFRLGVDRPIYGLQATGLDEQALSQTDIVSMATQYIQEIKTLQPEGPYFLGGLCVGGVIALEMAQQLQAQGEEVPLVAVFGISPLSLFKPADRMPEAALMTKATRMPTTGSPTVDFNLASRPWAQIAKRIYSVAAGVRSHLQIKPLLYRFYQRTGRPFSQDLQRFHIYQIMVRSVWNRAQARRESMQFKGRLLVFWASQDRRFSAADQLRWTAVAPGKTNVYSLPEAHISHALKGSCAQSITEILRQQLADVQAEPPEPILAKSGEHQLVSPAADTVSGTSSPTSAQPVAYASAPWTSLIAIKPTGTKPPLFCIHDDEGTNPGEPLYGYDLARHINADQPIYGLRAIGLDGNTPPLKKIEDIAAHYLIEMQAVVPTGPYLLLGVGVGGLIAFEIAQQLSHVNQSVLNVIIIDMPLRSSPTAWVRHTPTHANTSYALRTFLQQGIKQGKQTVQVFKKNLQCRSVIRAIKQHPLPNALRQFKMQQSLHHAQRRYRAQPSEQPLTLLEVSEQSPETTNTAKKWSALTSQPMRVHPVPGNRLSVFKSPHIQFLVKVLETCLAD